MVDTKTVEEIAKVTEPSNNKGVWEKSRPLSRESEKQSASKSGKKPWNILEPLRSNRKDPTGEER